MKLNKQEFIEKVKTDATYKKFITRDAIILLSKIFNDNYKKEEYSVTIDNPLDIVLEFYKEYNVDYYNLILSGINGGNIQISKSGKSFVDTYTNKIFIRLSENDCDIYVITHELAHFIDRRSKIIDDNYWFLSETFALYFEKRLENWLDNKKYKDLINARKHNRMFFESRIINVIIDELYYEDLYNQKGNICEEDIDVKKMNKILSYDVDENIVNVLLQYPFGNIISDYLINNEIVKDERNFVGYCLNTNIYEIFNDKINKKLGEKNEKQYI